MHLYLAMMVIVASSNYLVQFPINDWLTWGAFTYPLSFFVTEITNYLRGTKQARYVVYVGFLLGVLLSARLSTPRIASASGLAFLVSQLLDISVFNSLRRSSWWVAPLLASLIASLIDTVIFWTTAFAGEPVPLLTWATGDFLVKVALDIGLLLPFRLVCKKYWKPSASGS